MTGGKGKPQVQRPSELQPGMLQAEKKYTCVHHPHKEAYCICVKCGDLLCPDCNFLINGRRYCESCTLQDEQLVRAYQREILRPKIIQTAMELQACRPPKHISDLPRAFSNMIRQGPVFFATAKDSSFHLTYYLAALAMIPSTIVQLVFRFDEVFQRFETEIGKNGQMTDQLKASLDMLREMPVSTRILVAILSTLVQILLLDLMYWACIRAFTSDKMKFTQAGSLLHFCLLPLFFMTFGGYFDLPIVSFIALALMIIQATTAVRASTRCSFMQGMGVMLTFIMLATLSGILS